MSNRAWRHRCRSPIRAAALRAGAAVVLTASALPVIATAGRAGTTPAPPGPPPITSVAAGNQQVDVVWSAPESDGGSAVTGYTLHVVPGGPDTPAAWTQETDAATTSWTVTGLENGRPYTFEVRAGNVAGDGRSSGPVQRTPRTVPAAPTVISAVPGDTTVDVSWSVPADGGAERSGYTVRLDPQGAGAGPPVTQDTGPGVTTWQATGLENGRAYLVQVRASNVAGDGDWSPPTTATPRSTPGVPVVSVLPDDRRLDVSWTVPVSGVGLTGYEVRLTPDGGSLVRHHTDADTTSWSVPGLTNGLPVTVQVLAERAAGDGAWSDPVTGTPRTLPAAPVLTATPGEGSVALSWTTPADGGAAVTGYTVRVVPQGAGAPAATTTSVGAQTHAWPLRGLDDGRAYEISVAAVNAAGAGAWSGPVSATPDAATAAVVSAAVPTQVHVGSPDLLLPGAVVISRPRTSVNVRLVAVPSGRGVADGAWRSAEPGTVFSGTLGLRARDLPAWGSYRWRFTAAAPSRSGTADVSIRLHTLLGLQASRSGDRITVSGSARAYHSVLDTYKPWDGRPVTIERWTGGTTWSAITTVATDDLGNLDVSFRMPFTGRLRLRTPDTPRFWGATSGEETL